MFLSMLLILQPMPSLLSIAMQPLCLMGLTDIEEMLIACIKPIMHMLQVYKLGELGQMRMGESVDTDLSSCACSTITEGARPILYILICMTQA